MPLGCYNDHTITTSKPYENTKWKSLDRTWQCIVLIIFMVFLIFCKGLYKFAEPRVKVASHKKKD